MEKNKSLVGNVIKFSISSSSSFVLLLLMIIASRYLGPEDFGRFSFALALAFIFDPILDPGLSHLFIREISRGKERASQYLSHAIIWKLLVFPIMLTVVFLVASVIHSDTGTTILAACIMAIAALQKSIKDAFRSVLIPYEFFGLDALSLISERIFLLILATYFLAIGYGLIGFCLAFVFVRSVDLVVIRTIVKQKICGLSFHVDRVFLKKMLFCALPIGAYYITFNIYNYVDTIMLSFFRNDEEVGWYNASYKLYEGLMIIPVVIGTVFMSRISKAFLDKEKETFESLVQNGLRYLFIFSILVLCNGYLLATRIIENVFGASYVKSADSLIILLLGVSFVFCLNFLQTMMIAIDKQLVVLRIALAGLVGNVCLNLWLIPQWGYVGAATATVVIEVTLAIFLLVYVHTFIHRFRWWDVFGISLLAGLVSMLASHWLVPDDINVYVKCLGMSIGFLALLALFGFFRNDAWVLALKARLFSRSMIG